MEPPKKKISVVTGCFNEEENVRELYEQVKAQFDRLSQYSYEHIFIDNSSTDKTVEVLKTIAWADKDVKIIVNSRNFGPERSPYYGMLQGHGDAVIYIVADLQDPPALIPEFIAKWEEGYKMVLGIKRSSEESPIFSGIRKTYYYIVTRLSEVELIKNFTGYGIFDKSIMDILREIDDPYPFVRGLLCEIGFDKYYIPYDQPVRKRGFTKHSFFSLYDLAMLGIIKHSKVPLRLATMTGFAIAFLSLAIAFVYLVYKLLFWSNFTVGIAPVVIGLFFFAAVQLLFIGIIGEYIGVILSQVLHRPIVIEKERINFD